MIRHTTSRCLRGSVSRPRARLRRNILTLAIESSCDDSCVAILEKHDQPQPDRPLLEIHHHEKFTSNNLDFKGVHPLEALHGHQENLAKLAARAVERLPKAERGALKDASSAAHHGCLPYRLPDLISVTRGPGMRSNLNAGLDLAKGLAVAWQKPLIGVNHMQAHALTPRLVAAMASDGESGDYQPSFPFLSLLVSGGHTMLIRSEELTQHTYLASTQDIAIGDAIDKIARDVLPEAVIAQATSTMYGPMLERFAFPRGAADYRYSPPASRAAERHRYTSPEGWTLGPPLADSKSSDFSFTGLCSAVKRAVQGLSDRSSVDDEQRRELAVQAMRLAFEHLVTRVRSALDESKARMSSVVVSGGVASNLYLRHIMRAYLDKHGYEHTELLFPPVHLCVDNAVMIGWAGIEMFEAGWHTDLSVRSLRKWSLDSNADDGGILGVPGWLRRKDLLT